MADTIKISGGAATPSLTLVQCDQVTIRGDGSHEKPLHVAAVPAGVTSVATDGTTILGNGTTGSPLHVPPGSVAVSADGTTILGNGTTGDPLHVPPGSVSVAVDGTTILGSGTTGSPLRSGDASLVADFVSGIPTPGLAVITSTGSPSSPGAVTVVQPGSGDGGFPNSHHAIGIVSSITSPTVVVQLTGPLALTTGQWDAVTGGSGGLTIGSPYYLARGAFAAGLLTKTPPSTSGDAVVQVGVALSHTTMLLSLPGAVTLVP